MTGKVNDDDARTNSDQSSKFQVQGSKDGGIACLIVAIFVAKAIRHFWKGLRRAYA